MEKNRLAELVKMARKKNNAAIEELYRAYYADVKYICSRYNLNDADSSDVAQETFIKAFDTISTLDNPEKFPAWLGRIAANKCIDLLRHNKTAINDTVSNDELMTEITEEGKTVEEIIIDKEVKGIIYDMISRLPSEQQITIFMYYYQDYSIKEIAEICGCSENTVKSRMHYARKFMRNEAEKLEDKGVKLRTAAALPFLYAFFSSERKTYACEIPSFAVKTAGHGIASVFRTAAGKAATVAAGTVLAVGGIAAALIISGCHKSENTGNAYDMVTSDDAVTDNTTAFGNGTEESTDNTAASGKPEFTPVAVGLYGTTQDSRYMSVILHTDENRMITVVYDMETSLKDVFLTPFDTYVDINDFAYRFSVSGDKYSVIDATTTSDPGKGLTHIAVYEEKEDKKGNLYHSWVADPDEKGKSLISYYALSEKDKDYSYNTKTDLVCYISDEDNSWYSSMYINKENAVADSIFIRFREDADSNYYIYAPIANPVPYNDDTASVISASLKDLPEGNIRITDGDEITGKVSADYGSHYDIGLADTVFYQDIVASKISENYGLSLKDKAYYYETENLYIEYHNGSIKVKFKYESDDLQYSDYSSVKEENRYEYTDGDGNKYSYFYKNGEIVIFKNEKFVNTAMDIVRTKDMKWYEALGSVFGIRE